MQLWLDYDSSINNLIFEWVNWMNKTQGLEYKIEDVASYDWVVEVGKKHNFDPFSYFNGSLPYQEGESFSTTPISGSQEFVLVCQELLKDKVGILTATHDGELVKQKDLHIFDNYGGINVVHDTEKHEYAFSEIPHEVVVLMDDNPDACEKFAQAGGVALLFDNDGQYKFANTDVIHPNLHTVSTYEEAMSIIVNEYKKELSHNIEANKSWDILSSDENTPPDNLVFQRLFPSPDGREEDMFTFRQEDYACTASIDDAGFVNMDASTFSLVSEGVTKERDVNLLEGRGFGYGDLFLTSNPDGQGYRIYEITDNQPNKIGETKDLILKEHKSYIYDKTFLLCDTQIDSLHREAFQYLDTIKARESLLQGREKLNIDELLVCAEKNGANLQQILLDCPRDLTERNTLGLNIDSLKLNRFETTPDFDGNLTTVVVAVNDDFDEAINETVNYIESNDGAISSCGVEKLDEENFSNSVLFLEGENTLRAEEGRTHILTKESLDVMLNTLSERKDAVLLPIGDKLQEARKIEMFKKGSDQFKKSLNSKKQNPAPRPE